MIIAIGDIHGDVNGLFNSIESIISNNKNVSFVQLGDFGLGFRSPSDEYDALREISKLLIRSNSQLYIIRGNHDNPILWHDSHSYKIDRITFVPDDSIIKIEDKVCYFAGGGISIDRCNRILNVSYWKDEDYCFRCKSNAYEYTNTEKIDILFTHDVYHGASMYGIESELLHRYYAKDLNLKNDIINLQQQLKLLYEYVYSNNPKFTWYHGHYHAYYIIDNNGQVTCSLGINEFKEVL